MTQTAPSTLSVPTGLVLAMVSGVLLSTQGRINGSLGVELHDGIAAAFISFCAGLVVIVVVAFALPAGRRALRLVPGVWRDRSFPRWYMLAGLSGAYVVLSQSLVVGILGIAVFTVANVTGQMLGGLAVDGVGFGQGGRRPITGVRVVGAVLMLAAVVWAVSPRFGEAVGDPAGLILPVLLPLTAGIINGFQTAMNSAQNRVYGSVIPGSLANFLVGAVVLAIALGIKVAVAGPPAPLPHQFWLYIGGPIGLGFVALAAYLARHMGVLITALGMIAGQLLGSLALDALWPTEGSPITGATIAGSALAIVAMAIASIQPGASLPWERTKR